MNRPVRGLDARRAAVIGDPVTHSRSPAIHNAAFAAARASTGCSSRSRCPRATGPRRSRRCATLGIGGLSVTMPHKSRRRRTRATSSRRPRPRSAPSTPSTTGRRPIVGATRPTATGSCAAAARRGRRPRRAGPVSCSAPAARPGRSSHALGGARRPGHGRRPPGGRRGQPRRARAGRERGRVRRDRRRRGRIRRRRERHAARDAGRGAAVRPRRAGDRASSCSTPCTTRSRPRCWRRRAPVASARANGLGMLVHQAALAFEQWTGERAIGRHVEAARAENP